MTSPKGLMQSSFLCAFLGRKQLLQFTVTDDPYFNLTENGSMLKCSFTLHRNPSYLVINNYLPSLCMMTMTILPLYLNEEIHFATAIMLVLTSLLCLYTIFQSSISDVPKTAYLKYIDYWNIFTLTVAFINYFALVIWEIYEHKHRVSKEKWQLIKDGTRAAMPIISAFGVGFYFIAASVIYFEI